MNSTRWIGLAIAAFIIGVICGYAGHADRPNPNRFHQTGENNVAFDSQTGQKCRIQDTQLAVPADPFADSGKNNPMGVSIEAAWLASVAEAKAENAMPVCKALP